MKKTMFFVSIFLMTILIFGCTIQQPVQVQSPSPIPSPIPSAPAQSPSAVAPTIRITDMPLSVAEGETFSITWRVDSDVPLTAIHTAIHYDTVSHPGNFGTGVGPTDSGYPTFTKDFASGNYPIPATFTVTITAPTGSSRLYLRAHAIINGQNYWTDEVSIAISKATIIQTLNMDVVKTMPTVIGTVMTGLNGMTLYIFRGDSNDVSNCYGSCAGYWPPLLVSQGVNPKGQGTTATFGVIQRTDGTYQVTANGMPLYYFSGDSSIGDINGQGSMGSGALWYVISPSGTQITTTVAQTSSSGSGSGYSY